MGKSDDRIACKGGCGRSWPSDEAFESDAGGHYCNLGGCDNAPICDECADRHYERHE